MLKHTSQLSAKTELMKAESTPSEQQPGDNSVPMSAMATELFLQLCAQEFPACGLGEPPFLSFPCPFALPFGLWRMRIPWPVAKCALLVVVALPRLSAEFVALRPLAVVAVCDLKK